jgi:hypothetical protein
MYICASSQKKVRTYLIKKTRFPPHCFTAFFARFSARGFFKYHKQTRGGKNVKNFQNTSRLKKRKSARGGGVKINDKSGVHLLRR